MGENTKIEWATHTLNFWEGCTRVSEGCAHCYAAERDARFHAGAHWGAGAPRRLTSVANWMQAAKWNREAEASGMRPRVFVNSLSDIFDPEVPVEWRAKAFDLMHRTPCVDYLLVTKRPELWAKLMLEVALYLAGFRDGSENPVAPHSPAWEWVHEWISTQKAPANLWIGTTVENQARAEERIPALLAIPAAIRFLSVEPMLGPVDLTAVKQCPDPGFFGDCLRWYHRGHYHEMNRIPFPTISWVICGGESGHDARPFDIEWARDLLGQCGAAGVAFFVKRLGPRPYSSRLHPEGGSLVQPLDLKDKKGGDMEEWPTWLRVRAIPEVAR